MEISVSFSAINGLTRRRAEIPDVIFLQMFSVLGFQDKCWSIVIPRFGLINLLDSFIFNQNIWLRTRSALYHLWRTSQHKFRFSNI